MNKSKFLKKSLAMLLALMLVLAMIPLSASAAELPNMGSIYVNGSVVKLPEGNSGTMTVDIGEDANTLTMGTNIELSDDEYQVKLVAAIEEDGLPKYKKIDQGVDVTEFKGTDENALSRWAPEDVMTLEVYPIDDIDFHDMKAQYTLKLNRTPYNTTTTLASVKEVESTGVYSIENSLADINATRKVKVTAAYDETGESVNKSKYKIDVTADKSATVKNGPRVDAKDDSKFEVVSQSGNNTAEYIVETTYVDALTSFTVNGVAGVFTDEVVGKPGGNKGQDDHMDTITVTLPKEAVLDKYGDVQDDPTFKVEYSVYAKTGTIEFQDAANTKLTGAADYTFTGLGKDESFSEEIVATVIGDIKQTYKLNVVLEPDTDTSIDRVVIKTFDENGKDQTNVNELGYPEGDAINVELPNNANRANSKVTVYTSTTVKSVSVAGVTKSSENVGDYSDQGGLRIWTFGDPQKYEKYVDLTSSKLITVTAQDNSIEDYTLTATLASVSKRPAIESFSIEDPDTGIVYSGTPNTNDVIELEKIPYMTTNIGNWVVRVTAADGTTVLTPKGYAIPSGQFTVYDITDVNGDSSRITTIPTTGASFDVTATDKTDTDRRTYTVKVALEEPGSGKTLDKLVFTSQKPAPDETKLSDEVVFRAKDSDNTFTADIDQSKKEIILRPALSLAQTGYKHIVTSFTPAEGGVAFFESARDTNAYLTPLKITDDDDDKENVTGTTIAEEQHAIALGSAGATKRVVVLPEKLAREVIASADKKIALATVEKYGTIYEVKVVPQEALTGAYLHTFKVGDVELKVSGNTISGTIPWSYTVADNDDDKAAYGKFAEFTLDKYAQMSSVNADEDDPKKIVPANFYSKGDINGDGTEDAIYSPVTGTKIYENFKFVFVRGTDNSVEVYQANEVGLSDDPISVVVEAEDRLNNGSVTSETYHFDLEYQAPERNANIDSFKLGKYDGTISDTDITVRVPYNTDVKGMIATFTTSTGAKVYYGDDQVKSGETVLNYSSPVKLVVHSEKTIDDDPKKGSVTVKTYTVTVVEAEMFSDVSDSKWYYDYVLEASNLGIINGKGDGIFAPEEDVTRGDFAVMLTNMLGVTELPHVVNNPFADVNEDIYYSDAIAYCYYQGYIGGYPDGSYRPEATITRQEAAKIIAEALELTETDSDPFTDDNLIHEWAEDYVYQCKAAGIFGGDAGTGNFRPTDAISRAETAKIMVVAYNNK